MKKQTDKTKYIKVGSKVYIHKLKKTGFVQSIKINKNVTIAYVEMLVDGEKVVKAFSLDKIDLYRERYNKEYNNKTTKKPLRIKVKYFDKDIEKIKKIDKGDWIDLRASETVEMKQFDFKIIPLGIGMKLPQGYEANVVPRSSTYKNFGIIQANHYGVIDNSYSGNDDQWGFPAIALRDTKIKKGDRICQFRINKEMDEVEFEFVDNLDEVSRGGFGSTGTK